jgi:uncharacterized protein (TIGR02996 family)
VAKAHPEYDALYAAVCAAPDDDTPRLVLADWLDEHDDPARAAYIRAQVGLHRAQEADPGAAAVFRFRMANKPGDWSFFAEPAQISPAVASIADFTKRCSAVAGKAESLWKRVLGRRKSVSVLRFERGFPYRLKLKDPKHYAEKQPPERLPGFSLSVAADDGPGLDAVLACANFAAATGLDMYRVRSPDPIRKVGACPAVRNFRHFGFFQGTADPAIPTAIATQSNWSGLTFLHMTLAVPRDQPSFDLPDAFAGATHLRTLTALNINWRGLTGGGVERLAALGLPRLRRFEVGDTAVDETGRIAGHPDRERRRRAPGRLPRSTAPPGDAQSGPQ